MRRSHIAFALLMCASLVARASDLLDLLEDKPAAPSNSTANSPKTLSVEKLEVVPVAQSPFGLVVFDLNKSESWGDSSKLVSAADSEKFDELLALIAPSSLKLTEMSNNRKAIIGFAMLKMNRPFAAATYLSKVVDLKSVKPQLADLLSKELSRLPNEFFAVNKDLLKTEWVKPEALFTYEWANLSPEADSQSVVQLIQKAPSKEEREALFFRLASVQVLEGKVSDAVKIYKKLSETSSEGLLKDMVHLQIARLLYGEKYFEPSLSYYNKISSKSPVYFLALEEKGWANLSIGKIKEQSEANHKILDTPMVALLTPEFFVQKAVGEIKSCQYSRALDTVLAFKSEVKKRKAQIDRLRAECSSNCQPLLNQVFATLKNQTFVPEYRNILSSTSISRQRDTLNGFANKENYDVFKDVAFDANQDLRTFLTQNRDQAWKNVAQLAIAQWDMDETELKDSVKRMYVADAEIAQQVLLTDRKPGQNKKFKVAKPSIFSDRVTFKDDQEVWLDEISHFKVESESVCEVK